VNASKVIDLKQRRVLLNALRERDDVACRRLLEDLARDGSVLERIKPKDNEAAVDGLMQLFLDHGVRPSLDVVRAYVDEHRSMWERLNRKQWSERARQGGERVKRLRLICTAVLAVQAVEVVMPSRPRGKNDKIGAKHFELARRLLWHFGIPQGENLEPEKLTGDAIAKTWKRFGTRIRPDDDLLDVFVYAQRKSLLT
jgi:hypothetical protein